MREVPNGCGGHDGRVHDLPELRRFGVRETTSAEECPKESTV
jgi:hypothetical protein